MASDWECVPLSYNVCKNFLQRHQTHDHPLKLNTVTVVDSKGTRANTRSSFGSNVSDRASSSVLLVAEPLGVALDGTDPLSQFAHQEYDLMDPLSQMATEYESFQKLTKQSNTDTKENVPDWTSRRLSILNRFTTSEKLSIATSFLSAGSSGTDTIKAQTVVADKVKYRLEQLDDFEDGSIRHMMDLTQQEYIQRIEQLNQELVHSWNNDQRVKALKIAIQCAKMLADTSVLQFYPSQFVLITDILDIFGKLVYERLSAKANLITAESMQQALDSTRQMSFEGVKESARETCQNWFFKIASIRELLPRLYVEVAIIKCYEFISESALDLALVRIARMIRGIGDPLVATYLRAYLVRVGLPVIQKNDYIKDNFNDFLCIYHMMFSGAIRSELNRQRIDMNSYLSLYGPAIDFILQALVYKNCVHSEEILSKCEEIKNNGPLLISILNAFKAEFIASNAFRLVKILANSNTEGIPKGQQFRALGSSVSRCPPLLDERLLFFNQAFETINTFTDPFEYINCVETWAQFIAENCTISEVNDFLRDINKRMIVGKAYEKHYNQLQHILYHIMQHYKDTELLLIQENFLPYLDLFHKESVKIAVCKNILSIFQRNNKDIATDAIVTNALMYMGKILNDSVTAITVEDERRNISNLISSFIRKVDFGRDFDQQLSFYVEARGAFANLDSVYTTLIFAVNKLAIDTRRIVDGKHTRKTAGFVKACVAFCFITIPSIASVQMQMDLYLLTGQVALLNLCLGQADSCFEASLKLVTELPRSIEIDGKLKSMEAYLVSYLCNMMATLVVVPDSPDRGVLYLFRLLLDVLYTFPFELHSSGPVTIYLHALDMLYVQSLEEFPYHIPEVISNDELYGHDKKFLCEVNHLCSQVVEQILIQLKTLGLAQQFRQQANLALELFIRIVRYADLSKEKTFNLALNLWLLTRKHENLVGAKLIAASETLVHEIYNFVKDYDCDVWRNERLEHLISEIRNKSSNKS